jgi:NAD-dependent deacetylase
METLSLSAWERDPATFWRDWREHLDFDISDVQPNEAHLALARLESMGLLRAVITQNIDGLHQKAGSQAVVEIHGSGAHLVCSCGARLPRQATTALVDEDGVPRCPRPECGRALKPGATLFEEELPQEAARQVLLLCAACDLILCVGSSLTVEPVATLPSVAKRRGARLVIVARESAYDAEADLRLCGDVAEEMEGVMEALLTS